MTGFRRVSSFREASLRDEMTLRLYNSLTHRIEPFEPLHPNLVAMYMCGPTVRSHAHIGNFRTFLLGDLMRRYFEYIGYEVFQIMNLTDVDDRTIQDAASEGLSLSEHTEPFVQEFFEDRDYLRIRPAHEYPRATEYSEPMIELVNKLLERNLAYVSDDGSVYYAVDAFDDYGRLTQLDKRELKAGARVASDEYDKEDARDFALWKAVQPIDEQVDAVWDAPFGRGRPGWHLECSAMALTEIKKRYGIETLDIHAGGVDLLFPHHENEIAQSEGATGKPFARFWVHGEFLTVSGTKMSKRYGNILTPRDLREQGVDAAAVRMLIFSTHYRQQLHFTDDSVESARGGIDRLHECRSRLEAAAGDADSVGPPKAAVVLDREFRAAMDDDLNAPKALGALFSFVRTANRELNRAAWSPAEAGAALRAFDVVDGVLDVLPSAVQIDADLEQWVEDRVAARQAARKSRDFATADAIREELAERGVELEDTPDGPRWKIR